MKNPNLRSISYLIPKSLDGYSIEAFLRTKGYSKRIISHLKTVEFPASLLGQDSASETGTVYGIMRNGVHAFTPHRLSGGDRLEIHLLETEESEYVPEANLPIELLYEDEDLQIVNKPAGLPIHPSKGHYEDSLGNALCYYAHHQLQQDKFIYRVINRLDRDTSGLLISAKNMLSAGILGNAITRRDIHREYLAICEGNPMDCLSQSLPGVCPAAFPEDSIVPSPLSSSENALRISAPILDQGDVAMKRQVDFERGERAVTYLQLLCFDPIRQLSLLRLRLETGRTHQIRVHMLYLQHPLIGDFLYHPGSPLIGRQALHSHRLSFLHPITGKPLCFTSPLPEDMQRLFPAYRYDPDSNG